MPVDHPKPVLEPPAERFAADTAAPPHLSELSVADWRKTIDGLQSGDIARPAAAIEEIDVEGGPTGGVTVRIVRPAAATGGRPAFVYLRGGWVAGSALSHDRLVRELATRADAAAVFVDYDRSPEARYPVAVEQSYAVLQWVAAHGDEYGLDPDRIAIAGDSGGATMAAAVTLITKQRSGPPLAAQLLYYPATDATTDTASYREFATGYWLRRDTMRRLWDLYAPADAARAEVTCSPLRATTEQLAGLPAALVVVAEADVLRDEGEAYAAKLRAAGVPVTAVRYEGTIHDFVMLDALRDTAAARSAVEQGGEFLHHELHGSPG